MKKVAVIGAGPAGVSASYELSKRNFEIDLHEKSDMIGGLARTIAFSKSRFDVGPHRFFTYNKEVENLYLEILGSDAVEVKRLTRILYNNKLFNQCCTHIFIYTRPRILVELDTSFKNTK